MAKAASPKLTINIIPKMVEYHFGSRDIIQSMAAKLTVSHRAQDQVR